MCDKTMAVTYVPRRCFGMNISCRNCHLLIMHRNIFVNKNDHKRQFHIKAFISKNLSQRTPIDFSLIGLCATIVCAVFHASLVLEL